VDTGLRPTPAAGRLEAVVGKREKRQAVLRKWQQAMPS